MNEFHDERFKDEPFEDEFKLHEERNEFEDYIDEDAMFEEELKEKQDDFLDVYSDYMKLQSDLTKNILKRKALELEILDPDFQFNLD